MSEGFPPANTLPFSCAPASVAIKHPQPPPGTLPTEGSQQGAFAGSEDRPGRHAQPGQQGRKKVDSYVLPRASPSRGPPGQNMLLSLGQPKETPAHPQAGHLQRPEPASGTLPARPALLSLGNLRRRGAPAQWEDREMEEGGSGDGSHEGPSPQRCGSQPPQSQKLVIFSASVSIPQNLGVHSIEVFGT